MFAVEFDAKIRDGMIEVPENLRSKLLNHVRVIVLSQENGVQHTLIDQLLENPLDVPGFLAMKREAIYE